MAIDTDKYFFWAKEARKIAMPFVWVFVMAFIFWVPFLRPWWWLFAPLLLVSELKTLYLWWIDWDFAYAKTKWVVLEIIPPKEILTPLKGMEDILTTMWNPLFDGAVFREIWCEGELQEAPYWMSWEMVSIHGIIHFYARVMAGHRSVLEATLYSYYPDLEIREVSDYVKDVPNNIPNEEWDLYGEEFIETAHPAFSIKTYEKFFEPQGEKISAEEKRIDPINSLLEAMARLGEGEQYWVQFIIAAAHNKEEPTWRKEAQDIVNKIIKRQTPKKTTFFDDIILLLRGLIIGPEQEGVGEKATYKWLTAQVSESEERELLLTPGERESVKEIEDKLKKPVFRATLRGMYIAKRENWFGSNRTILRSYMGHFNTSSQILRFDSATRTKVHNLFRKRRVFYRARRMIRNAILRFPPYFPDRRSGNVLLSPEELATLFHFPVKITSLALPTVERIEHRKGGPPPNLPIG